MATADLTRPTAGLMLAQHPDNLLFCKPFSFHHKFSFPKSPQENSLPQWPGFRGKGHTHKHRIGNYCIVFVATRGTARGPRAGASCAGCSLAIVARWKPRRPTVPRTRDRCRIPRSRLSGAPVERRPCRNQRLWVSGCQTRLSRASKKPWLVDCSFQISTVRNVVGAALSLRSKMYPRNWLPPSRYPMNTLRAAWRPLANTSTRYLSTKMRSSRSSPAGRSATAKGASVSPTQSVPDSDEAG